MCVISELETKQGIQGSSWEVFTYSLWCYNVTENEENTETRQYPCHLSYHVLQEEEVTHFKSVGFCCLLIHWKICLCWLFKSSKITKIVVITQFSRYFVWRALSNWHTTNLIKRCVLLWFFSIRKFNIKFDVKNQVSVILPIQRFCDILEQASLALNNVPLKVKNFIHAINIFDSDYIMSCSTTITSFANTLKNIYLGGTILDKLTSTY